MATKEEILEKLKNDTDVINAAIMSDDMKKEVLKLEMKRIEELVPFINKGMEEAMREEEAIVIVKDTSSGVINSNNVEYTDESTFTLRSESGKIIGESIYDEEELEELRGDPNVYFLSDNFVTYQDATIPGEKQFFVLNSEKPAFFTTLDLDGDVKSSAVAIPSTETDHYIRDCFNLDHDAMIGTVIIGFTPSDS